jgi:hypothetical protein
LAIDPPSRKSVIASIVSPKDISLAGDISGNYSSENNPFTSFGVKPDKNRTILKAYTTQFSLRSIKKFHGL